MKPGDRVLSYGVLHLVHEVHPYVLVFACGWAAHVTAVRWAGTSNEKLCDNCKKKVASEATRVG